MMQATQDEEHLRLLAIFHYVVGGMLALFACVPIIHVSIGLVMLVSPSLFGPPQGGAPPPVWVGLFFVILGGLFIVIGWTMAGLMLYAGRCLSRRQRYLFCMVVAGVSCLFFPLGTALGVFTIIVLNRPSVKQLFEPGAAPRNPA